MRMQVENNLQIQQMPSLLNTLDLWAICQGNEAV